MSDPYQVLLYYLYTPIEDPDQFAEMQTNLCNEHDLRGRIIIAEEGINGTVSGTKDATEVYIKETQRLLGVAGMEFKIDSNDGHAFKKLSVKVRSEIVSLHLPKEQDIKPEEITGERLSPEQFLEEMENDDVLLFDGRNKYESDLGRFKGAICPPVDNFRDFPEWIRENFSDAKNKRILSYCTGGIRCEKLSGFLIKEGFSSVAQLDGGIINYGKNSSTKGKNFDGQCYVFDQRIGVEVNSTNPKVIATCRWCEISTQRYKNCAYKPCNLQIFICEKCESEKGRFCDENCQSSAGSKREAPTSS
ncbi:MAG: rhodanese-related sulfurtransferase [Verrucomicrobiota bacterium]|nr:rhodanese-related sulfurtransferase [Verrucomicrobiota bacterium]